MIKSVLRYPSGLILFCLFLIKASQSFPLIYPSLSNTHGFVYVADTNEILSLSGATIGPLLCSTLEDKVSFEPAKKTCSDQIIIFVQDSSIKLQVRNLSSNGVVIPIINQPKVRKQHSHVKLAWKQCTAYDCMIFDQAFRGHDHTRHEVRSFFHQKEGLSRSGSADPGSNTTTTGGRSDQHDKTEAGGEGFALFQQLRKGSLDKQFAIDPRIEEANKTLGFLLADGSIVDDDIFRMELEVNNLPINKVIALTFEFNDGSKRKLRLYYDATPNAIHGHAVSQQHQGHKIEYRRTFEISNILYNINETDSCQKVKELIELMATGDSFFNVSRLKVNDLTAVVNASDYSGRCSKNFSTFDPELFIAVYGVKASLGTSVGSIRYQRKKQTCNVESSTVLVKFELDEDDTRAVTVVATCASLRMTYSMNLSGDPLDLMGSTRDLSEAEEVREGRIAGTVSATATAGVMTTSTILTTGFSIYDAFAHADGALSSLNIDAFAQVSELFKAGQIVFLMSKMAVPHLPEGFRAFGDQMKWTMLNIDFPWQKNEDQEDALARNMSDTGSERRRRQLLGHNTAPKNENRNAGSSSNKKQKPSRESTKRHNANRHLTRVVVWSAMFTPILLIFHLLCISICFTKGSILPQIFRFPRLEITFGLMLIPPLSGASASLMNGSENQFIVGVILAVVFPLCFISPFIYAVYTYVFLTDKDNKIVEYHTQPVGCDDSSQFEESGNGDLSESTIPHAQPETHPSYLQTQMNLILKVLECIRRPLEKPVLTPLFGRPYEEGEWINIGLRKHKFSERYGPLFEDYRGTATGRKTPGENGDETIPLLPNRYEDVKPVSIMDNWAISHIITSGWMLISLAKTVMTACIILGNDEPENIGQTVALFSITLIFLLLLRLFRPHTSRYALALDMMNESIDLAIYAIFLSLFAVKEDDRSHVNSYTDKILIALVYLKLLLIILGGGLTTLNNIIEKVRNMFRKKSDPSGVTGFQKAILLYTARIWNRSIRRNGEETNYNESNSYLPMEETFWIRSVSVLRKYVPSKKSSLDYARLSNDIP